MSDLILMQIAILVSVRRSYITVSQLLCSIVLFSNHKRHTWLQSLFTLQILYSYYYQPILLMKIHVLIVDYSKNATKAPDN